MIWWKKKNRRPRNCMMPYMILALPPVYYWCWLPPGHEGEHAMGRARWTGPGTLRFVDA